MTYEALQTAIAEAERFLRLARLVKRKEEVGTHTKEWADCKQASMDLTGALVNIR